MEDNFKVELWEGCITWNLPYKCLDVRSIRDLPENQEIFMSEVDESSWLFDLMQNLDGSEEEDILVHWMEICEQNEAEKVSELEKFKINDVKNPLKLNSKIQINAVYGDQLTKNKQNKVRIWIALIRLSQDYATDIIITWNETNFENCNICDSKKIFQKVIQSIEWNNLDFIKK